MAHPQNGATALAGGTGGHFWVIRQFAEASVVFRRLARATMNAPVVVAQGTWKQTLAVASRADHDFPFQMRMAIHRT